MRDRFVLGPLTAVLLISASASHAFGVTQSPMDPAAFAAELQRLSAELSRGAPGEVPQVRFPGVWLVEVESQRFEMPAGDLRRSLEEARRNPATWPARRAAMLAQLAALEREAQAFLSRTATVEAPPDPARAREVLGTILARREFSRMAQQSALDRLRQRVVRWLLRMWERLGGNRLGRRGTALVFAWIAVLAALAALTTWLVRFIMRADRGRRFALSPPAARRRSARWWAREALHAPDAREATRYAYRAAVCGLEEEGAWRPDDARTPREYLRLLPEGHGRRSLLADVSRRFEEIWFGAREATDDDRRAVLARLKELGCLPAD